LLEPKKIAPFVSIGFLLSFALSCFFSFVFPSDVKLESNLWFGADIGRVIEDMANPLAGHYRLTVHPLFSLLILPVARPMVWMAQLFGLEYGLAMGLACQLIISISAGLSWVGVYLILLSFGLSRFRSFVISLLFLCGPGFLFWWSTPETFPLGAVTVLIPFLLLALNEDSQKAWIAALIGSFSMTVTNVSAGLIAAFVRFGPRRAFYRICWMSMVGALVLIVLQKSYLPSSGLPFNWSEEKSYMKLDGASVNTLYQFFIAPVAPLSPPNISSSQLEFSLSTLDRLFPLRGAVALAWSVLLCFGIRSALLTHVNRVSIALAAFLVFQIFLHVFYGDTPFLYSSHYLPVMILLAGYGVANARKMLQGCLTALVCIVLLIGFPLNTISLFDAFRLGSEYLAK
jgi:hypothetical protein